MNERLQFPENSELNDFTEVVVIRPPTNIDYAELTRLTKELERRKFLPVVLPRVASDEEFEHLTRYFPTDRFRQVGDRLILDDAPGVFASLLEEVSFRYPEADIDKILLNSFDAHSSFPGAYFLHLDPKKVVVYDKKEVNFSEMEMKNLPALERYNLLSLYVVFEYMKREGWKIFGVDTSGISLKSSKIKDFDLDFLCSVFLGIDNRIHALAAESASHIAPEDFITHTIPDSETLRGGCNVADLRHGSILIAPNRIDAPTANETLHKYAAADIIDGPENFVNDGAGLRCSISSFRIY